MKRYVYQVILGWTGALTFMALCGSAKAQDLDLEKHLWTDRVILLFYSEQGIETMQKQKKRLESFSKDLEERDLVVYSILKEQPPAALQKTHRLKEGAPFTLLLLGKDGGVKLRDHQLVDPQAIFEIIDAMPMRQREMRPSKK